MSERRMLIPVLVERTTKADVPTEAQENYGDNVLFTVIPLHGAFQHIRVSCFNDREGALEFFQSEARKVLVNTPAVADAPDYSFEMVEVAL